MKRPKMTSSSGSDLEVEVRSGLEEGRIAPGRVSRALTNDGVVEPSGDREFKDLQGREVKMPLRVLEALDSAKEFREKRKFKYLHLFSGCPDVLSEAIVEEGKRNRLWVECKGVDRKSDKEIDLHETETITKWKEEVWDGSFSMARWKPGGPPPVRSQDEIYGMATNNLKQQQEADRGTLAATRSVALMKLQCARADARGVPSHG